MGRRFAVAVGLAAVLLAGCAGDDTSEPTGEPQSAEQTTPDQTTPDQTTPDRTTPDQSTPDRTTPDQSTPDRTTPVAGETAGTAATDQPEETEAPDDPAPTDPTGLTCDDVFSVAEMTDFIGEPVQLVENTEPGIGQIVCSWETPEDPDDADDLAYSFVLAQIFTGDPIPGENFVDPTLFDEVTPIDDLGDLAFWEDSFGTTFYFVDGSVAGVLSYTDADFGDPGAPTRRSLDEVLELFRQFHDRVM